MEKTLSESRTSRYSRPIRRLFLVVPPSGLYRRDDRCQSKVDDQTVRVIFPPIELAILASVARGKGAEVMLKDYPAQRGNWTQYHSDLRDFRPDAVLANVTSATIEADLQALDLAREHDPNTLTLGKGEYFDHCGKEAFARCASLDIAFHGEIEKALEDLVRGVHPGEIGSLMYRSEESGEMARNKALPFIENLDGLPLPARDLLDNDLYLSPETRHPITVIYANRGCPAKCIYCPAGVISDFSVRFRSPDNVIAELEQCVSEYGLREFLFHGDTFTINKRWVMDLCQKIIDRGLKIRWGCNSRVDTIDDERAALMKKAGCWVVAFGVESGVQELLDKMKKGARVEKAREAMEICKRYGLRTHNFFVVGLPWETKETLEVTFRFAKDLDADFFDFNIAYPLPGTEFYDIAAKEGLFEHDISEGGYGKAAVRSFELSSAELTEWRRKALLSMYLRPRYILRTLRRAGSLPVMMNYVRAASSRLRNLVMS